jgi:hypothetical protein
LGAEIAVRFPRTSLAEATMDAFARLRRELGDGTVPVPYAIVLSVTAVEAYADRVLEALVTDSGISQIPLGRMLLKEKKDRLHESWPSRHRLLALFRLAPVSNVREPFETLVDLRNAFAHGGHGLTPRQKQSLPALIGLESRMRQYLDVSSDGALLYYTQGTAERGVSICIAFIDAVDSAVQTEYGRLRL